MMGDGMMQQGGGSLMMLSMGIGWLLLLGVIVLGIVALIKYLRR